MESESDTGAFAPTLNPEQFRANPAGHVYGIVDNPEPDIPAVTAELLEARIPMDGFHVYCCHEGRDALDPDGSRHGLRQRIQRMLRTVAYPDDQMKMIEAELEAGHALIGVAVDDEHKGQVAAILRRHSGHDIIYFGKYTWQTLS